MTARGDRGAGIASMAASARGGGAVSAFLAWGEGAPVVCLHGIGGAAALWEATARGLPGRRLLAWNQPGYGGTPLITPLTFRALADALAAQLDAPAVDLVGHSMGGMIAMEFALRHPTRVRRLVLYATTPAFGGRDPGFAEQFMAARLGPLDAGRSMAECAAALAGGMCGPGADQGAEPAAIAAMAAVPEASYRATLACLATFDRRAEIVGIAAPTLCLAGAARPRRAGAHDATHGRGHHRRTLRGDRGRRPPAASRAPDGIPGGVAGFPGVSARLHWLEAAGTLDPWRPLIAAEIGAAWEAADRRVALPDIDILVQRGPWGVIPHLGMGGTAYRASLFSVSLQPENGSFAGTLADGALQRLVVHELGHCLRYAGIGHNHNLGDAMVSEGLCGHFTHECLGTPPEAWEAALSPGQLAEWLPQARAAAGRPHDHDAWFFGRGAGAPPLLDRLHAGVSAGRPLPGGGRAYGLGCAGPACRAAAARRLAGDSG